MSIPGSGSPLLLASTAAAAADAAYVIPKSLRFNSGDSAHLSKTFASAGNRRTWTWSGWIKKCVQGSYQKFFFGGTTSDEHGFRFENTDQLSVYRYSGSFTFQVKTTRVFRDPSAFFHLVVAYDSTQATASNRVKIYINGVQETDFATSNYPSQNSEYGINNTVEQSIGRLSGAPSSEYFNGLIADIQFVDGQQLAASDFGETRSSDGVWVAKEYDGTYGTNGFHLNFSDSSTNEALGFDSAPTIPELDPKKGMDVITYTGNGGTQNIGGLGFEPGLVWIKSRSSTSDHELYDSVRGATKRLFSSLTSGESAQSAGLTTFNPDGFTLGGHAGSGGSSTNYVAWTWRAGGPAVSNTDGSVTSQVSANNDYGFSVVGYTSNSSAVITIGHGLSSQPRMIFFKDRDAATNWFVHHNDGSTGRMFEGLNTTSAGGTNLAALNDTLPTSSVFTLNSGGYSINPSGNHDMIAYCWSEVSEFSKFGSYSGSGSSGNAITTGFKPRFLMLKNASSSENWVIIDSERGDNLLFANLSNAEASSDVVDFTDDGFTLNQTGAASNASGSTYIYAAFADRPGNNWDVNNIVTNEGLTTNKDNFDILTWTGDGSSSRAITGLQFSPGLLWVKRRNSALDHFLWDSVRGITKELYSNQSYAEGTATNKIESFDDNGFTVKNNSAVNANNDTYVAWCWKAGGTAVSNTDGSITSSVSANAQYGFSIVSYTGTGSAATVGHGLNAKPGLIIIKNRDANYSWTVFHDSEPATKYLLLDSTAALDTSSTTFNDTEPTSSVFSVGTFGGTNGSSNNMIAYCFVNIPGYQRIGSYTGNGSSTGPVVVTGFKPRWILIKRSDSADSWQISDTARGGDSSNDDVLFADLNSAESATSNRTIDFLNNGFQLKGTNSGVNGSGGTYLYIAIGDDEIGSDEDCLVDVPNAVTADADATDTTGGYQRGNYPTVNPLVTANIGSLEDGNLKVTTQSSNYGPVVSTMATSGSGKWYAEIKWDSGTHSEFGLVPASSSIVGSGHLHDLANSYVLDSYAGQIRYNGGSGSSASVSSGDLVGIAFDESASQVEFFVNGNSVGTLSASSSTTGVPYMFGASDRDSGSTSTYIFNFGQMRFKYPIPSGYAALNTTALPDPTIADGSTVFEALTYTGNGTDGRDVTGFSFSPDWVWIKGRTNMPDGYPYDHFLADTVRGAGKSLASNTTSAESSNDSYGYISQFNSDGFRVTAGSTQDYYVNETDEPYIAWAWDAGSSTVSNTDGSQTTSVRANAAAGFSIVEGANMTSSQKTFGHGLNAAPEMIIGKRIGAAEDWNVYHKDLTSNKMLVLNDTTGEENSNFSGTPTSSVFTYYPNADSYIFYCFAPVAGYSAIGSYTGNGSSDGVFVHTGFKVRFLIIKQYDGTNGWFMWDTERDSLNPNTALFSANANNIEQSQANHAIDFLSNGFKARDSNGAFNGNGSNYIYIAFASHPFQANGGLAR